MHIYLVTIIRKKLYFILKAGLMCLDLMVRISASFMGLAFPKIKVLPMLLVFLKNSVDWITVYLLQVVYLSCLALCAHYCDSMWDWVSTVFLRTVQHEKHYLVNNDENMWSMQLTEKGLRIPLMPTCLLICSPIFFLSLAIGHLQPWCSVALICIYLFRNLPQVFITQANCQYF